MAEDRNPLEIVADLLVYAPVGFVVAARELLPVLAERGRAELGSQVDVARIVGKLAVRQGQDEVGRAVDGARQQLGPIIQQFLRAFADEDPYPPSGTVVATGDGAIPPTGDVPPGAEPVDLGVEPPAAETLAIRDYDSLSASQVLPRLAALDPDELEAVRRYEEAGRGRRTVLGRIAQLQG